MDVQIQELLLYEFELGHNAAVATKNIALHITKILQNFWLILAN